MSTLGKQIKPRYEGSKEYFKQLKENGVKCACYSGTLIGDAAEFDSEFTSSFNNEPATAWEINESGNGELDVILVEEHGFFLPDGHPEYDYYYAGSDEPGGRYGIECVMFKIS